MRQDPVVHILDQDNVGTHLMSTIVGQEKTVYVKAYAFVEYG
jgi:thiamine phosphate synthase YjbQ (UPF0047 family)